MTLEDGHFRTDGKSIEPCCYVCKKHIPEMFFATSIFDPNKRRLYIPWSNIVQYFDREITECPWCGAKLEDMNKESD